MIAAAREPAPETPVSTPARIVLILLGLVVLAVGAGVVFLLTLDPERYRDDIARVIRENTDLDVRLDGPIDWQLWPSIALSVEDVAADWSDASGAGEPPLVAVRRMAFEARLLPLLSTSPRLDAERVTLEGVALDLRVDEAGTDNWSPPASEEAADDAPAPADEDGTSASVDARFDLARFEILDLSIRYRDATSATDAALSGLDLVGVTEDGERIDLRLSGRATVADGPEVDFDGRMDVDLAGPRMEFVDVGADVVLPDAARPVPIALTGVLALDRDADTLDVRDLALSAGEVRLTAAGTVHDLTGTPRLALDLGIPDSDLRALLARLDAVPATRDGDALTRLSGGLRLDGTADDLRIQDLELALDALRLTGTARVRADATGGRTALSFGLDAGRLDLGPYLAAADASTPEPAGGPLVTDEPLDLSALRTLDIDGTITADAVITPQITLGASRIEIDNRAGRLQARVVADDVFGGAVNLLATVNAADATPTIGLTIDADALAATEVLPGAGFTGPLGLDGRIDATGASSAALARAARGRIRLAGDGGTLDVTELKASLAGLAQLLGKAEKITAWPDTLGYRQLEGTWTLADGLGDQRLELALDNLRLDATGGIDLASGDFTARASSVFAAVTPRTFDVPVELDGIRLPIRCGGNLGGSGNPCGFDREATRELIAQIARSKAGDAVRQRIEEQLPEDLRGPASQLLRGLFGQPQQQESSGDSAPR
jgi:AsmA protein